KIWNEGGPLAKFALTLAGASVTVPAAYVAGSSAFYTQNAMSINGYFMGSTTGKPPFGSGHTKDEFFKMVDRVKEYFKDDL
ncbi:MAG: hypothetical protein MI799_06850, partial [Desulfobacterales bacterium]|nr:hypothetical protein [Desulfobacterales bacterium]